jgi:TonB family protein
MEQLAVPTAKQCNFCFVVTFVDIGLYGARAGFCRGLDGEASLTSSVGSFPLKRAVPAVDVRVLGLVLLAQVLVAVANEPSSPPRSESWPVSPTAGFFARVQRQIAENAASKVRSGVVEFMAPRTCRLSVDGSDIGMVYSGRVKRVQLPAGDHQVDCVVKDSPEASLSVLVTIGPGYLIHIGGPPAAPGERPSDASGGCGHVVIIPSTPHYPANLLYRGIQGEVMIRMLVLGDGTVSSVAVEKSSGHGEFDRSAVLAARRYRFLPPGSASRQPCGWVLTPIRFALSN